MTRGAFRDDHDAALERAHALERDLAQARAERDAARAERDALRADAPPTPRSLPDAPPASRPALPVVVGGMAAIVAAGAIAALVAHRDPAPNVAPPSSAAAEYAAAFKQAEDYHLRGCVRHARELAVPRDAIDLTFVSADDCSPVLASAMADPRFSEAARTRLRELAGALAAVDAAYERVRNGGLDPSRDPELALATTAVRRTANAVPLESLPLEVLPSEP